MFREFRSAGRSPAVFRIGCAACGRFPFGKAGAAVPGGKTRLFRGGRGKDLSMMFEAAEKRWKDIRLGSGWKREDLGAKFPRRFVKK